MRPAPRRRALGFLALLALVAGCGGGSSTRSAEDIEDDIAAQLEESGLSEDAASCAAKVVVEEIGAEELQDVDFSAEEPPADLEEQITAAALAAIDECQLGTDGEQ